MRRYPLPPPAMWPCERPIVHVLNGDYPAAELRRMSVPGLARLVAKLVQRTSKAAAKPQWWPKGLVFTHPLDLGLSSEREIKLAFKQLIGSCCQFFSEHRRRPKHQLLHYLRLHPRAKPPERAPPPPAPPPAKLAAATHVPFSSDAGRYLLAREHHGVSEEWKLRRLERTEWYTNRGAARTEAAFEVAAWREPEHCHRYKMPRRQQRQRRRSMHDREFLARFCTPVSVRLARIDLDKLKSDMCDMNNVNNVNVKKKELVVLIRDKEKMSCDLRTDAKIVRTSPRLRNV